MINLPFWLKDKALFKFLAIASLVTFLDLVTKCLALRYLELQEPYPITSFLNLYLIFNVGVAFSLLEEFPALVHWLTLGLAVLVTFGAIYYEHLLRSQFSQKNQLIYLALAAFLGGAWGNAVNRMCFNSVIDFIDFHIFNWHFPAFNIADIAITFSSVTLLVWLLFRFKKC